MALRSSAPASWDAPQAAHVQGADLAARKLAEQLAKGFGQLQMGLELVHHFRRQTRDVDGTAGGQTQKDIANLFGHIDGHVFLRFFG